MIKIRNPYKFKKPGDNILMMRQNTGRVTKKFDTKRIALLGLLFALAVVLSVIESYIPIPVPVSGVKLGLSNIVIMFALFNMKRSDALTLAIMKSLFVAATRGLIAGFISISGGLSALAVMTIIIMIQRERSTYLLVSVAGAVFHNIGQFTAASVIMQTLLWPYAPVLLVSGILTGIATSVLLKLTTPAFRRLHLK